VTFSVNMVISHTFSDTNGYTERILSLFYCFVDLFVTRNMETILRNSLLHNCINCLHGSVKIDNMVSVSKRTVL